MQMNTLWRLASCMYIDIPLASRSAQPWLSMNSDCRGTLDSQHLFTLRLLEQTGPTRKGSLASPYSQVVRKGAPLTRCHFTNLVRAGGGPRLRPETPPLPLAPLAKAQSMKAVDLITTSPSNTALSSLPIPICCLPVCCLPVYLAIM